MSCINSKPSAADLDVEQAKLTEPEHTIAPRNKPRFSLLGVVAGCALLLSAAALALSIYSTVLSSRTHSDLNGLHTASGTSGTANSLAANGNSDSSDVALVMKSLPVPGSRQTVTHLYQGTGYYTRQINMLYSRSDHRTLPLGPIIYIIGGLGNAAEVLDSRAANANDTPIVLNTITAFNSFTNKIVELAKMPEPRMRFSGAVLGTRLFVIAGMKKFEGLTDPHVPLNTVMVYDTVTDKWTMETARLNVARSDCCSTVVHGRIYVAGGYDADYNALSSAEVYDPAVGSWVLLPNMTTARGDCEVAPLPDGNFFVMGGWNGDTGFLMSTEAYNTVAGKWQRRANMHWARGDFAAEALPYERVIVMGGESTNGTQGSHEYASYHVEEYVYRDDTWVIKAPLPEARFRFDTAHVKEVVYVFGGHPTCSSGDDLQDKFSCIEVALNSTWAYMDIHYPDVYISTDSQ